jgi:type IV pilus assembly protein PilE
LEPKEANIMKRSKHGFTLIELIVVMAVIAIIMAIAIPAYNDQVRKTRRSEAISAMQNVQLRLEQWRANNPSYANSATPSPNYPAVPAATNFYTFALSGQSPTGYTLTATAQGSQTRDRAGGVSCTPLTVVANAGAITRNPAACW